MKKILMTIMLLFLFSGCASKPIIIEKETFKCVPFQTYQLNDLVQIVTRKVDRALFEARVQEYRDTIKFYENQIVDYNKICDKESK